MALKKVLLVVGGSLLASWVYVALFTTSPKAFSDAAYYSEVIAESIQAAGAREDGGKAEHAQYYYHVASMALSELDSATGRISSAEREKHGTARFTKSNRAFIANALRKADILVALAVTRWYAKVLDDNSFKARSLLKPINEAQIDWDIYSNCRDHFHQQYLDEMEHQDVEGAFFAHQASRQSLLEAEKALGRIASPAGAKELLSKAESEAGEVDEVLQRRMRVTMGQLVKPHKRAHWVEYVWWW